jgi:hypothetical protein
MMFVNGQSFHFFMLFSIVTRTAHRLAIDAEMPR